ncbi:MAG: FadR/GntR family transcriptional regulator [Kiloniellaceae bacterium]|mgnify:CR=1 FL=1
MPVEIIQTKRLFQQVYEQLAHLIAEGEFPLGERLPAERDLARQLGVSRATVREAMIALEISGLVEVRVGAGVFVVRDRPLAQGPSEDPGEDLGLGPFEILEARRTIECAVAAFAAQQIQDSDIAELETALEVMAEEHRTGFKSEEGDRAFHLGIARATRNSALVRTVEALWDLKYRAPMWAKLHERVRASLLRPALLDDHREILEALRRRDPEAARAAMDAHLVQVAEDLLRISEAEFAGEVCDVDQQRGRRAVGR